MNKNIAGGLGIIAIGLAVLGYQFYASAQRDRELEEMRKEMEQARAQAQAKAKAIAAAKAKFEALILTELNTCKASAETAKTDFITKNQVPVRKKPGQFTVPPAVASEAEKNLESANAACQIAYDARLKSGS